YGMDQLRDAIGFRAFSQLDPRIEYKREGQRLFLQMMENVRDRVTDFIFKARLSPQASGPGGGGRPVAPRAPSRPAAPVGAPSGFFGSISGPGLDGLGARRPTNPPPAGGQGAPDGGAS
ncbi:MAG: hypothetical protein R3B57_10930, partial [Phycisphaerales bacterium]